MIMLLFAVLSKTVTIVLSSGEKLFICCSVFCQLGLILTLKSCVISCSEDMNVSDIPRWHDWIKPVNILLITEVINCAALFPLTFSSDSQWTVFVSSCPIYCCQCL